jgi:hypothetical protein
MTLLLVTSILDMIIIVFNPSSLLLPMAAAVSFGNPSLGFAKEANI